MTEYTVFMLSITGFHTIELKANNLEAARAKAERLYGAVYNIIQVGRTPCFCSVH